MHGCITALEHTQHWFLQPPPLSSDGFGGFHLQAHSKVWVSLSEVV